MRTNDVVINTFLWCTYDNYIPFHSPNLQAWAQSREKSVITFILVVQTSTDCYLCLCKSSHTHKHTHKFEEIGSMVNIKMNAVTKTNTATSFKTSHWLALGYTNKHIARFKKYSLRHYTLVLKLHRLEQNMTHSYWFFNTPITFSD